MRNQCGGACVADQIGRGDCAAREWVLEESASLQRVVESQCLCRRLHRRLLRPCRRNQQDLCARVRQHTTRQSALRMRNRA